MIATALATAASNNQRADACAQASLPDRRCCFRALANNVESEELNAPRHRREKYLRHDLPSLDSATEQNLRRLESLAQQNGHPGEFETIHSMVVAAIETMKMLPEDVGRHFDQGAFMIGATHDRVSSQRRIEIWQRLATKLTAGLDAVSADDELRTNAPSPEARPQTTGERIEELCRELSAALSAGQDLNTIVVKIEAEASGTAVSSDAREMRRLLNMKRIPDLSRWRSDFHFAIGHAERVAWQLHSMPARYPSR
jgi:hypothetical protein